MLRVTDPRLLGRFTVDGRLAEHPAGIVYSGRDGSGGPVVLVVLAQAAASDAAVRDRFAAVLAERGAGRILDAAPQGPLVWAALPREEGPDGLREATALLDVAGLTAGEAEPGHGPRFAPHWSPSGPAPGGGEVAPASRPAGSEPYSSRLLTAFILPPLVAGLVMFLVYGIVIGWQVWSLGRPDDLSYTPVPTPSKSSSPSASPPVATGPRGGKGPVAGPRFGKGEDTHYFDLPGMPFGFYAPASWGCLRSDQAPFTSRWLCIDEGDAFPPSGGGAGGFVAVQECAAPCDGVAREQPLKLFSVDDKDWRRIDSATMYAEVEGELQGERGRQVRVALSRAFASRPGGGPDMVVAVQLTGPRDQRETMQKLINEIHYRTS